eukprot:TRINITY_DN8462_c0_g1_i5.p1 TRINITY_DN8462_c0_g1~~TRINITY_DN8462_c0_g1_i5.p1  ORF type:complete len:522 (+),score=159.54 TRINITY_DN8462_c0_g1_i5:509-2074(+)
MLSLDQEVQTAFMNTMLKYTVRTSRSAAMDPELIESLMAQLKQKEQERAGVLAYLKTLEDRNMELGKELEEVSKKYAKAAVEKEKCLVEMDELSRRNGMSESAVMGMEYKSDLEEENGRLKSELNELKAEMEEVKKAKDDEIEALKDSLDELRESKANTGIKNPLVDQLKVRVADLTSENQSMARELEIIEALQTQIDKLQKENKQLEDSNKQVLSDFYGEQNNTKRAELELKKQANKYIKLENDYKIALEKYKFAEQRAKELEESLDTLKDEYEQKQGAHSLFSQRNEIQHDEELIKLRLQVQQLQSAAQEDLNPIVIELKAKLKNTERENGKAMDDLAKVNTELSEITRENQNLKSQIEALKKDKEAVETQVKEFNRVRKDKDTLLELARRAQNTLKELEEIKLHKEKLERDNRDIRNELVAHKNRLTNANNDIIQLKQDNTKLNNEIICKEQRIAVMEEKLKKVDTMSKLAREEVEKELKNKFAEELSKKEEALRNKLKDKSKIASVIISDNSRTIYR